MKQVCGHVALALALGRSALGSRLRLDSAGYPSDTYLRISSQVQMIRRHHKHHALDESRRILEEVAARDRALEAAEAETAAAKNGTGRSAAAKANASEVIPNVVYFTGPWDPERVVQLNQLFVPKGTEFRYYDYAALNRSVNEISALLEKDGVDNASAAFHELRPRSYRTDLWRYMILWQNGGIYLDAKMALLAPLAEWVDQARDPLALCWDMGEAKDTYWTAMIAARKRNPTLKAIIKKIISNTLTHYYGEEDDVHGDLDITGPEMLTRVLRHEHVRPRTDCQLNNIEDQLVVVSSSDGRYIAGAVKSVHGKMRNCTNCDSYSELYADHQVYCSEPGPACTFSFLSGIDSQPLYLSWVV